MTKDGDNKNTPDANMNAMLSSLGDMYSRGNETKEEVITEEEETVITEELSNEPDEELNNE